MGGELEKRRWSRRDFLRAAALGTLAWAAAREQDSIAPAGAQAAPGVISGDRASPPAARSVVAIVEDPRAVLGLKQFDRSRVKHMLDEAILALSGKATPEEGWISLLPPLRGSTTFGLKVNCINPLLPSHPELVEAIAASLIRIGVKENNILIWDRVEGSRFPGLGHLPRSGFILNTGPRGVRCLATDSEGIGYDEGALLQVPSVGLTFPASRLLSQLCDYIINLPVLKDHGVGGVTLSLKNYYGAIPLYDRFSLFDARKMHRHNADPQIAELFSNPLIRRKNVLNICDALVGCYHGGPSGPPQWNSGRLLVSQDPVALDELGLRLIDQKRREQGLSSAAPRAGHIRSAARLGLGIDDPARIELREIQL